jgi:hypothetical protein
MHCAVAVRVGGGAESTEPTLRTGVKAMTSVAIALLQK